jgi:hypothetical protein
MIGKKMIGRRLLGGSNCEWKLLYAGRVSKSIFTFRTTFMARSDTKFVLQYVRP